MNGWRLGGVVMGQPAGAITTEPPAEVRGTWESLRRFIQQNRLKEERLAKEHYHEQRRAIAQQAEAGKLSESAEKRRLEQITRERNAALAKAAQLWVSLDPWEKETHELAHQAALEAIGRVWQERTGELAAMYPDHDWRLEAPYA